VRRGIIVTIFVAALLGCTPMAFASVFPSVTTTIMMDCSEFTSYCAFDPGDLGSPEQGLADFTPVAPGWSVSFASDPAIAWGSFGGSYQAEFGAGGFFAIAAPGGMQLVGALTSGVAFSFPGGYGETVAWFRGYWNNGLYGDGVLVWNDFGYDGAPAILEVTTSTPELNSILLFGSGLAGLAGLWRRKLQ
jgi:hypothetical protein